MNKLDVLREALERIADTEPDDMGWFHDVANEALEEAESLPSLRAMIPVDPAGNRYFVNAVGSSENECSANLSMIEVPDEVTLRTDFVAATILPNKEQNNDD